MKKVLLILLTLVAGFGLAACTEPTVEEATVDSLFMLSSATKVEYQVGEEIDLAGLQVRANFSDGTDKLLTADDYVVSGFNTTIYGEKTMTISYGGQSVQIVYLVFDDAEGKVLMLLQVETLPTKQTYNLGEDFDNTGMVVNAIYRNGVKEVATEYTISGFDTTSLKTNAKANIVMSGFSVPFLYSVRAITVQGVTDTTITVGNTAATSGFFAAVGVPFNAGIEAYFKKINDGGGIAGRTLEFVTYDDGFDATNGLNYTKQLIEEDNVFALVGHFGTPTVGATVGLIQTVGIPMVYAATGINSLYFEQSVGNPVMAVQPIYKTDGRIMTARALNEALFGVNGDQKLSDTAKVGVLYTADDAGNSIKAGIEVQAITEGRRNDFIYKSFSAADTAALNSAVLDFVTAGVGAVIVASNQAPFKAAVGALNSNGLTVPVFTSYVNADATSVDPAIDYAFDMYANAWLDIVDPAGTLGFSAEYWTFATDMTNADYANYSANAYAMAGYIAAAIFVEGIERVGEDALTWESYIKAMEEEPIEVPMGGTVDFSNGKRWGIASMALLQLDNSGEAPRWAKVRDIEDISIIQGK